MYRRSGAVVVVLLVALAGCVGGSDVLPGVGDGTGGSSGPDGGAGADGDSAGASDDGLVANRTAVLADAGSHSSTWRLTLTEGDDVTSETAYTGAVDHVNERSNFLSTVTDEGETVRAWEMYTEGDTRYTRYGEGESATYTATEERFTGTTPFGASSYVVADDGLSEFDRTGTETFDGVSVTRYVLTERPGWVLSQAQTEGDVRWTDFEFEVLVDEEGLVRAERWTATGTKDGVTHTIEFAFEITSVGSTTVDEPDWIATAREQREASGQ